MFIDYPDPEEIFYGPIPTNFQELAGVFEGVFKCLWEYLQKFHYTIARKLAKILESFSVRKNC